MSAARKTHFQPTRQPLVESAAVGLSDDGPWDPLHPMHQELARRLATYPEPEITRYSRPARLAIISCAGIMSWGAILGAIRLVL